MAKSKKRDRTPKQNKNVRAQIQLNDEQYVARLLVLLEAREAQYDNQNVYFDLGGGERQQIVKAEFDLVARREGIPVVVHPVKGKRTLAFVFPPRSRPKPRVIVRGPDGEIKFQSDSG
ncbi:hypothetical protein [Acanthopleuribacter pedis]|uniref:Uncharacterized protein n=1 Tax=Acanthopleuribacter pedis TaxID=442870 RepID=A0A8J7QCW1_9BACT|nr:hypothetical protein [Acanthopleuribacter pedis]MBO1323416.1 hypothetical protein [Acanthopleuribacter pedis]